MGRNRPELVVIAILSASAAVAWTPTPTLAPSLSPTGAPYTRAGQGVAGPNEIWNVGNAKGKGVRACFKAVEKDSRCEVEAGRWKYFTYRSRGDKNCGCKGSAGALAVRRDVNSDYYKIDVKNVVCAVAVAANDSECRVNDYNELGVCCGDSSRGEMKVYSNCVTWDSVVFPLIGLALAFGGFSLNKISPLVPCATMVAVIVYWWVYPIILVHTDLSKGASWGVALAVGVFVTLALSLCAFATSSATAKFDQSSWLPRPYWGNAFGIWCTGFLLGVVLGGVAVSFLMAIDSFQAFVDSNSSWFPKLVLLISGVLVAFLSFGLSLGRNVQPVVLGSAFIGSFCFFCGVDRILGNGRARIYF